MTAEERMNEANKGRGPAVHVRTAMNLLEVALKKMEEAYGAASEEAKLVRGALDYFKCWDWAMTLQVCETIGATAAHAEVNHFYRRILSDQALSESEFKGKNVRQILEVLAASHLRVPKLQTEVYELSQSLAEKDLQILRLQAELNVWKPPAPDRHVNEDGSISLSYYSCGATVRLHQEGDILGTEGEWMVAFGRENEAVAPILAEEYGHPWIAAAQTANSLDAGDFCETCKATDFPCPCEIAADESQCKLELGEPS